MNGSERHEQVAPLLAPDAASRIVANARALLAMPGLNGVTGRLLTEPARLLSQLLLDAPAVLAGHETASERYRLVLARGTLCEYRGKVPTHERPTDNTFPLGPLLLVGLAAIASMQGTANPGGGLATVAGLIRAATPWAILARIEDAATLTEFGQLLAAREPTETERDAQRRLLPLLMSQCPEEEGRWHWVARVFEGADADGAPNGINALVVRPDGDAVTAGQGGLLGEAWRQVLAELKGPLWPRVFEPLACESLQSAAGQTVHLKTRRLVDATLDLPWVEANEQTVTTLQQIVFQAGEAAVLVPEVFRGGRVGARIRQALQRRSIVRRAILTALRNHGESFQALAAWLATAWPDPRLTPPTPPSSVCTSVTLSTLPGSRDVDGGAEGSNGSVATPPRFVLVRPYEIDTSGNANDGADGRVARVRRATWRPRGTQIVELPWVEDGLAVVRGPVTHEEHPAVAELLRQVFVCSAQTPGLELSVWLVVLPETPQPLFTYRAFAAAALVVICDVTALLEPPVRTYAVWNRLATDPAFAASSLPTPKQARLSTSSSFVAEDAPFKVKRDTVEPEPELRLLPTASRLRILGRLGDHRQLEILSTLVECRRLVHVEPTPLGIEAVALGEGGVELASSSPTTADARRRPALFSAWQELSDEVTGVVIEATSDTKDARARQPLFSVARSQSQLRVGEVDIVNPSGEPVVSGASLPPPTAAVDSTGTRVAWRADNRGGARAVVELQVKLPNIGCWVPFWRLQGCSWAQAPLHRLPGHETRLRLAVADGWNHAASKELLLSEVRTRVVIRRVSALLWFAELPEQEDAFPANLVWRLQGQTLKAMPSEPRLLMLSTKAHGLLELFDEGATSGPRLLDCTLLGDGARP